MELGIHGSTESKNTLMIWYESKYLRSPPHAASLIIVFIQISDEEFQTAQSVFQFNTPLTKEAFLYRKLFSRYFHSYEKGSACEETVKPWIPKKEWGCAADPSGRAQITHQDKY